MPAGPKGGYDKARESFAKENNSGGNGLFGRGGDAVDRIVNNAVSGIGNLFSGGGKNSYGGGGGAADSGQKANQPSYGAMSLRGLTSSDPANVARNQAAAARYNAMPQRESENRGYMNKDKGIASLVTPTPIAAPVAGPAPAPVVAPPSVPGPVEVPTMGYAGAPAMGAVPPGYGSAFAGLSQPMANPYGGMNLMDIFSMYPDLRYM
jgi:hypothetical protein